MSQCASMNILRNVDLYVHVYMGYYIDTYTLVSTLLSKDAAHSLDTSFEGSAGQTACPCACIWQHAAVKKRFSNKQCIWCKHFDCALTTRWLRFDYVLTALWTAGWHQVPAPDMHGSGKADCRLQINCWMARDSLLHVCILQLVGMQSCSIKQSNNLRLLAP